MDAVGYEQRVQDLDRRQDDVLERLEELDRQLLALIDVWAPRKESTPPTAEPLDDLSGEDEMSPSLRRAA
ncbi:MAG TPA: hypothetical protein DCQ98_03700 [Planctomycetaceae bacterium]|nr:hypothetical protein [Planctomycetaceae bacterium]HRF01516.1 hypothetical protein [Pirellulaceae bacterium]